MEFKVFQKVNYVIGLNQLGVILRGRKISEIGDVTFRLKYEPKVLDTRLNESKTMLTVESEIMNMYVHDNDNIKFGIVLEDKEHNMIIIKSKCGRYKIKCTHELY